jgi:hypothetical protein
MAYYERTNCEVRTRLWIDLIIENHLSFAEGTQLRESLLSNPEFFNLHHVIESMMSQCSIGLYEFNDGIHEDFTDGSECKTGTLYIYENSAFAEISSVRSKSGVLKHGAIRCVVLNPILEKLHFIFIPKAAVQSMMGKNSKRSLDLRYDKKLNRFRVPIDKHGCVEYNTFKELAMEVNR